MSGYPFPSTGPSPAASAMSATSDPTAVIGRRIGAIVVDFLLYLLIMAFVGPTPLSPLAEYFDTNENPGIDCEQVQDLNDVSGCVQVGDRIYFTESGDAAIQFVVFLAVVLGYSALQGATGRTPGKALFGLKAVDEQGERPGFGKSILRTILWAVDAAPWCLPLVGFITGLSTKGHRRVGDMAAKTFVVGKAHRGPVQVPGLVTAATGGYPGGYGAPGPSWGTPPPGAGGPPAGWGAPAQDQQPGGWGAPASGGFPPAGGPSGPTGAGTPWSAGSPSGPPSGEHRPAPPAGATPAGTASPFGASAPSSAGWSDTPAGTPGASEPSDRPSPPTSDSAADAVPGQPRESDPSPGRTGEAAPSGGASGEAAPPGGAPGETAPDSSTVGSPGPADTGPASPAGAPSGETASPSPAAADTTSASQAAPSGYNPQWDAARGTYIVWEPNRGKWLGWDEAAKEWKPL